MVNRVFCYSKEIANQNGNKISFWPIGITSIIYLIANYIIIVYMPGNFGLLSLIVIAYMILIPILTKIQSKKARARMSGWATTSDGRIFKVMIVNSGLGAGKLMNPVFNNDKNIVGNIDDIIGSLTQTYSIQKSIQYMSQPEIIAKIVEEAPNVTGAEVLEILKVHSITNGKHSVKINCDYKIIRTGKINYNNNMEIEKAYNQFNDLINIISTHRG